MSNSSFQEKEDRKEEPEFAWAERFFEEMFKIPLRALKKLKESVTQGEK